jgi:arylsulfatase A-like enzyme
MGRFLLVSAMLLVFFPTLSSAAGRPPNIILILADDIGAEAIGAYGGESYRTPLIDRMAAEGVRFEHGHAQPLCTPSRVKIMTGQYNFRNYHHFGYLDPAETTFAHVLGEAGYATAVIGKWQLFNNRFEDIEGALPEDAGFDEYVLWQLKVEQRGSRYWAPLIDHDGDVRQYREDVFGPDVLNQAALEFIEDNRERPFFLYYPMVLPHSPFVTTPDMRDEDADDQQRFGAMVAYMDKLVGRVRAKVEALDLAGNTLILFIGDNGIDRDIASRHKGIEVAGAKGKTLNTGTRVPFIAWGPGIVAGNRVSDSLVNLNDVLPTLVEVARTRLPEGHPGDGASLLPVLSGEGELPRENLFIHYEPRWPTGRPARYAFDRRWKFYEDGRFYDLQADPLERRALAPGGLDREGLVALRTLQARVRSMPGELDSGRRWVPTIAFVLVGAALLIAATIFIWVARLVGRLHDGEGNT